VLASVEEVEAAVVAATEKDRCGGVSEEELNAVGRGAVRAEVNGVLGLAALGRGGEHVHFARGGRSSKPSARASTHRWAPANIVHLPATKLHLKNSSRDIQLLRRCHFRLTV
jgi:hypothetical protein